MALELEIEVGEVAQRLRELGIARSEPPLRKDHRLGETAHARQVAHAAPQGRQIAGILLGLGRHGQQGQQRQECRASGGRNRRSSRRLSHILRLRKLRARGEAPLYLGKWAFWSATGCGRTAAPSRPEARSPLDGKPRMSLELQSHLPYPEQLPGREPASARKGFEDDDAFVLWCRCFEGSA